MCRLKTARLNDILRHEIYVARGILSKSSFKLIYYTFKITQREVLYIHIKPPFSIITIKLLNTRKLNNTLYLASSLEI